MMTILMYMCMMYFPMLFPVDREMMMMVSVVFVADVLNE